VYECDGQLSAVPRRGGRSLKKVAYADGRVLTEDQRSTIIGTFGELDAFPDVAPSMARLAESGGRSVILTNGRDEVTRKLRFRQGQRLR
jgi:FMN phosphatase YigB (HAD superfamily)